MSQSVVLMIIYEVLREEIKIIPISFVEVVMGYFNWIDVSVYGTDRLLTLAMCVS